MRVCVCSYVVIWNMQVRREAGLHTANKLYTHLATRSSTPPPCTTIHHKLPPYTAHHRVVLVCLPIIPEQVDGGLDMLLFWFS